MNPCHNILATLLSIYSPANTTEDDIRLAIDISAEHMRAGDWYRMEEVDEHSKQPLLVLINAHPKLTAVAIDGVVLVRKRTKGSK